MMTLGFIYFTFMCALGTWTAWQRRHAWGYWEHHTTTAMIALSTAGGLCAPILFFRNEIPWWGHAYVAASALTFYSLSEFTISLNRRHRFTTHTTPWFNDMTRTASITGTVIMVTAYMLSGAWRNPYLLDPAVNPDEGFFVRVFWTSVATTLSYLLAVIALRIIRLRADTRRGDKKILSLYLTSCIAGMILSFEAVEAAHGYGSTPGAIVVTVILLAGFSGGKVLTAGRSWRQKNAYMRKPPPAISTYQSRY